MRRTKQQSLFKETRKNTKLWWIQERSVYGGSLNYRKVKRPFDSKMLVHVVLKADRNELKFTRSSQSIKMVIKKVADTYCVEIKDVAINHDHIHLLLWAKSRGNFLKFLRLTSAELGRRYQRLCRKLKVRRTKPLWAARPFTRLISWAKKSLKAVTAYLNKNRQEATGFAAYTPRKHALTQFLRDWQGQMSSLGESA